MGWIITALLSILVVLLTFKIVKINKENKELKEDRTNAFETFLRYKTNYIEQKEKERRDTLRQAYDQEIAIVRQCAEIEKSNCALEVSDWIKETELVKKNYEVEQSRLQAEKQKVEQAVADGKRIAAAEVDAFKQKEMARINNEVQSAAAAMASSMDEMRLDLEKYSAEIAGKKTAALEEYNETLAMLEEYRQKRAAVNEAMRIEEMAEEELKTKKLSINDNDKDDIAFLLSIESKIHNKEVLRKLIWTQYIQPSFNKMIKKQFGNKIPSCVIYCIEDKNGKKYIGKTVSDVSKRWGEHIKASLSIGTISHQIIHDAMYKNWDDFIFYIIENTTKDKITEREKYYIKLFESDVYGYNMKVG